VRVGHAGQIDLPDTLGVVFDLTFGNCLGESGLADAARAGEGYQTAFAEQALDLLDLALPADEARELNRQVV
jgi:hypothetical protein